MKLNRDGVKHRWFSMRATLSDDEKLDLICDHIESVIGEPPELSPGALDVITTALETRRASFEAWTEMTQVTPAEAQFALTQMVLIDQAMKEVEKL